MILEIYLLCSIYVLVSPIPVNSVLAAQTYPIYQQNDYITPYFPTNDYNPSLFQNTAENAPSLDFKQILLNKILSRPSLQAILDPIANAYGLTEVPNSSLMPNVVNNYIILPMDCPNVNKTDRNEETSLNKVNAKTDKSSNKKDYKKKSSKKSREEQDKAKSERNNEIPKDDNVESVTTKNKPSYKTERNSDTMNNKNERSSNRDNKKRKQRQNEIREIKNSIIDNNNETLSDITLPRKRRKKPRTDMDNNVKKDEHDNIEEINITPPKATSNNKTKKLPKVPVLKNKVPKTVNNEVKNEIDLKATSNNSTKKLTKLPVLENKVPKMVKNEDTNETPLKATSNNSTKKLTKVPGIEQNVPNTIKNDVTNDFFKTFPSVTENMAKNFITGMNQFNDPQLMNFFGNYERFYQSLITGTQESNKKTKKRRKSKKNKRNRRKNQKNKARNENVATNTNKSAIIDNVVVNPNQSVDIESAPNLMRFKVSLNPVRVTTEKTKPTNLKVQTDAPDIVILNPKPITKDLKSIDTSPAIENIAALNIDDQFQEMDAREDNDNNEFDTPSMYYGLIDDYYPLFIDNAAYENTKITAKSLDNDRLLYTTDDVGNVDNEHPKRNINDGDLSMESIEDETERTIKEIEVQFRQPPLLESPDFITRKVERSEIQANRFDDIDLNERVYVPESVKYSSFSNAKSSTLGGNKQSKSKLNNAVETVYARSKVVQYGQTDNSEEEVDVQEDWDSFPNTGTTYVLAKSFDPGEFW